MIKFIFLFIILVYLGFSGVQFFRRVQISGRLIEVTTPFSFPAEKLGANRYKRILVAGDSLAVGIGSVQSEHSIAGRLHADFLDAEIVNTALSGAKLAGVTEQVSGVDGRFDLVVIMGGANDIIRFHSIKIAESDASLLLKAVKEKGDHVIWLVSGNIGLAPIWPWPIESIYTYRTRKYHAIFRALAEKEGIVFINLLKERADDVFAKDPARYYAKDGLHLSSDGYAVWYEAIKEKL